LKENLNLLTQRGSCLFSGSWNAMHTYVYTLMLHRFVPGLHARIYIFIRAYAVYLFTCVKNKNMDTLTDTHTHRHRHVHIRMCTCNTYTNRGTHKRTHAHLVKHTYRSLFGTCSRISRWACGTCRKLFEASDRIAESLC